VALSDSFRQALALQRSNGGIANALPTGIGDLDEILGGGLGEGELITVAARTSIGKTSVLLEVIANVAEAGQSVAFISGELGTATIVKRLCAAGLGVAPHKLWQHDEEEVDAELQRIDGWPLNILDIRGPELAEVSRWLKRQEPRLIVLDHIGKVQVEGISEIYPRTSRVADALYNMAGHFKCPVLAAAQINRGVEGRIGKDRDGNPDVSMTRPLPSDVEGSGKIEQNSDVFIALWREERYRAMLEQREEEPGPLEFNVLKNRNGRCGTVRVDFVPELAKLMVPGKPLRAPTTAAAKAARKAAVIGALAAAKSSSLAASMA
jgi:replicative DNA helicase